MEHPPNPLHKGEKDFTCERKTKTNIFRKCKVNSMVELDLFANKHDLLVEE